MVFACWCVRSDCARISYRHVRVSPPVTNYDRCVQFGSDRRQPESGNDSLGLFGFVCGWDEKKFPWFDSMGTFMGLCAGLVARRSAPPARAWRKPSQSRRPGQSRFAAAGLPALLAAVEGAWAHHASEVACHDGLHHLACTLKLLEKLVYFWE